MHAIPAVAYVRLDSTYADERALIPAQQDAAMGAPAEARVRRRWDWAARRVEVAS